MTDTYGTSRVWDNKLGRYLSADEHKAILEKRAKRREQVREAVKRHYNRKKERDPDWRERRRQERSTKFRVSRREAVVAIHRKELPPGVTLFTAAELSTEQLAWIWEQYIRREAPPTNRVERRLAQQGIYVDPETDPYHDPNLPAPAFRSLQDAGDL